MKRSLFSIIAIIVVIAINIASTQVFYRLDVSAGKNYSLSSASKDIIRNLEGDYAILALMSETLPPQAEVIRQQMVDQFQEYEALGKGNLRVQYIDPGKDDDGRRLAQALGIPSIQLNIVQRDKQETIAGYLGLAIVKNRLEEIDPDDENPLSPYEKFETIPVIRDISNLEYDISSALKRVSATEVKTVGFITGNGEHGIVSEQAAQNGIEGRNDYVMRDGLDKNYRVRNINLEEDSLENIDTIVIAGPQESYSEEEANTIHDFVNEGGNLIMMLDTVNIEGISAQLSENDFSNLLNPYGITVEPGLIADARHENARFSSGFLSYLLPYSYWVSSSLNPESAIGVGLNSFVLPWASPLNVEEQENREIEIIAQSSNRYAILRENFILDPNNQPLLPDTDQAAVPLAVSVQNEGQGEVIIIGDSDFASVSFTSNFPQNQVFFMNMVDSLTIGNDLISIRSKQIRDYPIRISVLQDEAIKSVVKWGNTILIPTVFIVYGLIRRTIRRNLKKRTFNN